MTTAQPSPSIQLVESGIRDNHRRGSVGGFLKEKVQAGSKLAIVSAYFTIYAYDALKQELEEVEELRFLFGEPRFVRALDPDKTDKKSFQIEDAGLTLQNQLQQKRVAKECADWIRSKVQIRSIQQVNLLHGKMYHISPPNKGQPDAIMGSSNFTMRGLGLGAANNIELNLEVQDKRDVRDLMAWFEEIWQDEALVEDVKDEVLHYLEQLYENHSPQFIYFKTLFHIFEQFLAEQDLSGLLSNQSQLVNTEIWRLLFEFQRDGARGAINKILTHNGCIIADSVGLGKTFEALAVIKYFELRNYRVLVLCPKRLRENWTVYRAENNSELNPVVGDRFGYTVLSHTDLSRDRGVVGDINLATLNWGAYDLVVIDESHNFRNNTKGRRDEDGNVIRKSRYERLMQDIIQQGIKTKVLLLSATPVNNDLRDLRNQIYLLTEAQDGAFEESIGIKSLQATLKAAQQAFTTWVKQEGDRSEIPARGRQTMELLNRLSPSFFTLLDELTIARSRRHIQTHYSETIEQLGGFPGRVPPRSIFVEQIDTRNRFPSFKRIHDEISEYQLALFNPIKYVLEEFEHLYDDGSKVFKQRDRELYLIAMMKVNFLKRLESSVQAFEITMDRTVIKIEGLLKQLRDFVAVTGTIEIPSLELEAQDDEDLQALLEIGKNRVYQLSHLDVAAWIRALESDREQLVSLFNNAAAVTEEKDEKLQILKRLIREKVENPTVNRDGQPNRKVLIFTAFADTAIYLYGALENWAQGELGIHIALITGNSSANKSTLGRAEYNQILTNFSPVAKGRALFEIPARGRVTTMDQTAQIDLLIATDCISEGQNLQDCDYLVNYDIHWNPVRIIQRFGRIDRIGSRNSMVQMVNFWPTEDLDQYIGLQNRVEARMALVDAIATQEDNLLAAEETIREDLRYRDRQLLRLKDEVLDLEDLNESVSLTDFTLDDFRMELSRFIEANRQVLRDAPLGLYSVVPTDPEYPMIRPGVIFCLRQVNTVSGSTATQTNPLQPYFLVYVEDGGEVRYTFAQPKQILEIYRVLCTEQTVPHTQLCDCFDTQTDQGQDMSVYDALLESATTSILQTSRRRSLAQLQTNRSAVISNVQEQVRSSTDFELITWLVVQDGAVVL